MLRRGRFANRPYKRVGMPTPPYKILASIVRRTGPPRRHHANRPTLLFWVAPADTKITMERDDLHDRRSIRLKGYDYAGDGAYFVTICTQGRERTFGAVVNGQMRLNEYGREVANCWSWLVEQYPYVYLDEWIMMPDHTHTIIVIEDAQRNGPVYDGSNATKPDVGDAGVTDSNGTCRSGSRTALKRTAPSTGPLNGSTVGPHGSETISTQCRPLGRLIGAFKTVSTKRVNDLRSTPGAQCGNATTTNAWFAIASHCVPCVVTSRIIPSSGAHDRTLTDGFLQSIG